MSLSYLLIMFAVSSLSVGLVLAIRNVFKKQLSARWRYNLWSLLFIALTLPFIPQHLFGFGDHVTALFTTDPASLVHSATGGEAPDRTADSVNWLQDISLSVQRTSPAFLNHVIAVIWAVGVLVLTGVALHGWRKLWLIQNTTSAMENSEIINLFEQCKRELKISGNIILGESPLVSSPMTFGLLRTYVVFPESSDTWLSAKDMKYIILHELHHYKNKDMVMNYFTLIFQVVYWFNPLVWIAFREMRLDREIACDTAVLQSLDPECYGEYGNTIIHFLKTSAASGNAVLASSLAGPKEQIKERIIRIAAFKTETRLQKLKGFAIFVMVGLVIMAQFPFVSVMAQDDDRYEWNSERVVYEDLGRYFGDTDGSFVLYDMRADSYEIYNKDKSETRVSPDSTYKIYSSLFGLEMNVITTEKSTLPWDGKSYPFSSWNRDQDLNSALKSSVNWYFQEIDRKVGQERLQMYLQQIGYGNLNLSGGMGEFWLESSLKISPVEQVQLLTALYNNEFGFDERHVSAVKAAIRLKQKDGAVLSGKTGTGTVSHQDINGWFIGYVENGGRTYIFAANMQNEKQASGSRAAEISLAILKDKGIF
ncbi:BlaR1 family beta-lactam sensor/signal transducer [Paenibacillus sp. P96]|uniref:BlaR1 family beta-lactam sensor/signal transducer n=1 Tax=Paenibacillus zeirhizosphaerae TaxID=2987519 RepID=A0ABT9FX06_9BACL|nr:BlaR1 family beta-lactam sensor/signal transducer [Paenibacillus sp. P96]MDP4099041.1 BlaR1 family beta-lactam sensor/signal transducer [Paenibacillus sp. P96]